MANAGNVLERAFRRDALDQLLREGGKAPFGNGGHVLLCMWVVGGRGEKGRDTESLTMADCALYLSKAYFAARQKLGYFVVSVYAESPTFGCGRPSPILRVLLLREYQECR